MPTDQSLSQEQEQAAYTFDAPICILAGAGSGKTRVITHRIAHLVRENIASPYNILGVTFTNKAAREMRERVERLLPSCGRDVILGTFHGLAARFLRYYGELVSVDRDFLIYDEDDAERLIKKIIKERYDVAKEELALLTKKVLYYRDNEPNDVVTATGERAVLILNLYQDRLQKMQVLDFCGLLRKFSELLEHEEGNRLMCHRIRHLVVDEYQDINKIQAKIVHSFAKNAESVAIVGDDDQSIYGWRGASMHFMQQFLDDFHQAKLFRLEDNYRSTKPILDCANAVIAKNQQRLGKNLRSISGDGALLRLTRHFRDVQEAGFVVEQALRLFEHHGNNFEIAVLMRTNAQSRPLEEALHKARMPYRMVGGMKFYDRKEIKDILAALRAVLYNHSDVDFLRLLNALPFGIGKKTQTSLSDYAGHNGISVFETMNDEDHQTEALGNVRSKKKITELLKLIEEMRSELISYLPDGEVKILRADEALIYIIDRFGFVKRLMHKDDDEAEARLENIEQLVQAAASFVEEAENYGEPADAQSFLESVALISKDESVQDESGKKIGTVTLMTLHAAKGLEFDGVFLIGLEDGVLPHSRSLHGSNEDQRKNALEEERRLLYVGMTRAKKRLFLSFCQERFLHGKTSPSLPSRFLRELPSATIETNDRWILAQDTPAVMSFKAFDRHRFLQAPPMMPPKNTLSEPPMGYHIEYDDVSLSDNKLSNFNVDQRVYHGNHREGSVISISGSGRMTRVKVRFDNDGQIRTIMATHLEALK
ncbi:MAG TPA: 3'-5' exonuclease [Myxococcota bacterium]|nr:3'-5' exonuclease [Myxococcota bacterium]